MEQKKKINWDELLSGSFVKLENGEKKKMLLKNWRAQDSFKDEKTQEIKPGLVFDVYREDNATYGETTKKTWTVTSMRALVKLRPIIEAAEAQGKDSITITVVKAGENKSTVYEIAETAF